MIYLILANLYLAVFYGFYHFFLRKSTFFQWNRVYLLATSILAFALPLIEYPALETATAYQYQLPTIYLGGFQPAAEEAIGVSQQHQPASMWPWVRLFYIAGCTIMAAIVLVRVGQTFRRLRRQVPGEAYSFFNVIRVDAALGGKESILAHEQVHVRQGHTFDVLWIQLLKVFNWFNPVAFLYERSLRLQHEYIADDRTAGTDPLTYARLLVARAMGTDTGMLKHTFSSKQTLKSRVAMLVGERSRKWSLVRFALAIPIVGLMAFYAAAHNHFPKDYIASNLTASDTAQSNRAKAFLQAMGRETDYRQEVLNDGGQGEVTTLFRKTTPNQISEIEFFNGVEAGGPLNEAIRVALTKPAVAALAPDGLNQLTIDFKVQGGKPPLPIEKPKMGTDLGKVTIVGYLPASADLSRKDTVDDDPDRVFQKTEIDPQPQGGMRAFMEWVGQNYDYPQAAIDASVVGKMLISFIVEKDGTLSTIKIVEDLGYGTGEAALRLLEKSAKWSPAIQNGKPVRVEYILPIRLNLHR